MTYNYEKFNQAVKNSLILHGYCNCVKKFGDEAVKVTSEEEAKKFFIKTFVKNL